uniref:Uncharacterized protein n=1 Tax=Candidatus Kentrum sp. TUN TaxID=2126343 RepID=A0A451AR23_9GAMM|nr:MAG: hypothetical protein BECKTUN1418F_GA0071002_11883 [Candidatus Kentron sp. TUN]VFK63197.1 MAG: hypothetical protein BECKTUN1418D_GA0071000_12023 [Candidatus Kentron sp. TUN]VFK68457.1 MAG: hypothetical protein BECKTUN1418E_GA0071001_11843 [Candidatus Kentron sp. TUN]
MSEETGNIEMIVPSLADSDGNIKEVTVFVSEAADTMGLIQRFKLEGMAGKELRKRIAEIAINLLEKQKEQIAHKLLLDLDADKKRLYQAYMVEVAEMDENISKNASETAQKLTEIMLDAVNNIYEMRHKEIKRLDDSLKKGVIDGNQYERSVERVERWVERREKEIEERLASLIDANNQRLQKTLELFQEYSLDKDNVKVHFQKTAIADVASCLRYTGKAKTLDDMARAINQGVKDRFHDCG